jgi:hypothetical protein
MAKDKIYVIPVSGLAVVKPGNRAMADRMIRPEGEYVPAVSYYLRAVRDGALKIGEPPKPKPKAKPASKPNPSIQDGQKQGQELEQKERIENHQPEGLTHGA